MEKEYDIETLVSNIDFNSGSFQNINGMMLTNHEIEVLDRYKDIKLTRWNEENEIKRQESES